MSKRSLHPGFQFRRQKDCQQNFYEISRNVWNHPGPQCLIEGEVCLNGKPCGSKQVIDKGAEHQTCKDHHSVLAVLKKQAADDSHENKSDEITAGWSEKFSEAGTERRKYRK